MQSTTGKKLRAAGAWEIFVTEGTLVRKENLNVLQSMSRYRNMKKTYEKPGMYGSQ